MSAWPHGSGVYGAAFYATTVVIERGGIQPRLAHVADLADRSSHGHRTDARVMGRDARPLPADISTMLLRLLANQARKNKEMSLDDAHATINFAATNRINESIRHEPQRECPRCSRCLWSVTMESHGKFAQCQFCMHISDASHHYALAKKADKDRAKIGK